MSKVTLQDLLSRLQDYNAKSSRTKCQSYQNMYPTFINQRHSIDTMTKTKSRSNHLHSSVVAKPMINLNLKSICIKAKAARINKKHMMLIPRAKRGKMNYSFPDISPSKLPMIYASCKQNKQISTVCTSLNEHRKKKKTNMNTLKANRLDLSTNRDEEICAWKVDSSMILYANRSPYII